MSSAWAIIATTGRRTSARAAESTRGDQPRGGLHHRAAGQPVHLPPGLHLDGDAPRNNSGSWSAWQPFAADKAWTLEWTGGTRTVSVEVRKGSSVRQASDTIDLTTSGNSLGNLPDALRFVYDRSSGKISPPSATLQPRNASSGAVLNWQATSGAGWLNPQTGSGATPSSSITVAPSGSTLQNVGSYITTLTFTAPSAPPKQIQVELVVVDALDNVAVLKLHCAVARLIIGRRFALTGMPRGIPVFIS